MLGKLILLSLLLNDFSIYTGDRNHINDRFRKQAILILTLHNFTIKMQRYDSPKMQQSRAGPRFLRMSEYADKVNKAIYHASDKIIEN